MGNKEDQEMLRKAGFTEAELNLLSKLRRNLAEECQYIEHEVFYRLLFVRWLVQTGRLTEQIVEAKEGKHQQEEDKRTSTSA